MTTPNVNRRALTSRDGNIYTTPRPGGAKSGADAATPESLRKRSSLRKKRLFSELVEDGDYYDDQTRGTPRRYVSASVGGSGRRGGGGVVVVGEDEEEEDEYAWFYEEQEREGALLGGGGMKLEEETHILPPYPYPSTPYRTSTSTILSTPLTHDPHHHHLRHDRNRPAPSPATTLKLRLRVALFKVQTNQTSIPLSHLQVPQSSPQPLSVFPPSLVRISPVVDSYGDEIEDEGFGGGSGRDGVGVSLPSSPPLFGRRGEGSPSPAKLG
ncbi:unnamed protein product [Tuber aestivum]|uniref:Uncharacterized protein n=1 Tax=Tuber aestivum TaxID=59557 RepID=A0A292PZ18_9PEZI|nr:unnamed protein product [Tuber aestivum]